MRGSSPRRSYYPENRVKGGLWVGILVFLVVAIITLVVYNLLPSNKNEEDFQ